MKHLMTLGVAAILVALASSRPAEAWTNAKFSIGLNWACQSGNNSLLWGFWRNGQVPDDYGPGGGGGPALPPGYGPPYPPGTQPFPYFGMNQQAPTSMPNAYYSAPTTQSYAGSYGYDSYFHPASYQSGYSPYYLPSYSPSYYTPNYYGYGQGNDFTWYYQR
jgi:hypothetical protein